MGFRHRPMLGTPRRWSRLLVGRGLASASIPPTITSSATPSIAEGTTAVVTVTATGGQTPYTFSISGGADQALFTINSSTGALAFLVAPDYEAPGDAGANNVYNLTVRVASAGGAYAEQNIAVTVTDVFDFTPADLTGLAWWMDPNSEVYSDSGTTPVAADGTVYGWVCQAAAGNRFDQSTAGNRPQYKVGANGKPFVRFDANSKFLTMSNPVGLPQGNSVRSFSIGMKASDWNFAFSYGDAASNASFALDLVSPGGNVRIVGFFNDTVITGIVGSTSAWLVLDCTYDGDTLSLRVNGGTPVTAATGDFNTDDVIAEINRFVGVANGAVMDMTHLVMTNTVMSTTELNNLVTYIQAAEPT